MIVSRSVCSSVRSSPDEDRGLSIEVRRGEEHTRSSVPGSLARSAARRRSLPSVNGNQRPTPIALFAISSLDTWTKPNGGGARCPSWSKGLSGSEDHDMLRVRDQSVAPRAFADSVAYVSTPPAEVASLLVRVARLGAQGGLLTAQSSPGARWVTTTPSESRGELARAPSSERDRRGRPSWPPRR